MRIEAFVVGVMVVGSIGCGSAPRDLPPLGEVSGTVTLDGKPLEGAIVVFEPETTRASNAKTDAQGKYELMFNTTIRGAAIGDHKVRISRRGDPLTGGQESVPARYNDQSELTVNVKSGKNADINFELKTL
jgi:hypothetical protein